MVRVVPLVVALVSLLLATNAFAATKDLTQPSKKEPLSAIYDCARYPDLVLPSTGLRLALEDATSAPSTRNLEKLGRLACKAAAASAQVATNESRDMSWVDGLPIILVDHIDGMTDQAHFKRDANQIPSRSVRVGSGLLLRQPEKPFLFVLGHELGHGVYKHEELKISVGVARSVGLVGTGLGALFARGAGVKLANMAAGAAIACAPGALNVRNEKQSDAFGVHVLVEAGITPADAKSQAISLLKSHPEPEPGCITRSNGKYGLPDDNQHPRTQDRIRAIERVQ